MLTQQAAQGIVLYYLGLDLALRGDREALQIADRVESLLNYQACAWHVRMVFQANAGDARELEQCRRRMEALAMREGDIQQHLRVGVVYTLFASVWAADLLTLSRELPLLELEAARFPGWVPWRDYVRGAHHALRGELALARSDYEAGLARAAPGEHQAWWHLAAAHLEVLVELGEHALAARRARELEQAVLALGYEPCEPVGISVAIALAEAHAGHAAQAMERLRLALATVTRAGRAGLGVGMLHEAMARVALLAGDAETFGVHARPAGECYRQLRRPGLVARYERLIDAAHAALPELGPDLELRTPTSQETHEHSLRVALQALGSETQAPAVLRWLLEHTQAGAGHLFAVESGRTRLLATLAAPAPDAALDEALATLLSFARDHGAEISTQSLDVDAAPALWCPEGGTYQICALRSLEGGRAWIRGIAVVECRERASPRPDPARLDAIGLWLADALS